MSVKTAQRHCFTYILYLVFLSMLGTASWAVGRFENSPLFDKAYTAYSKGDYKTARIWVLRTLKENPSHAPAHLLQARLALEAGNGLLAQTELEKAVAHGIERARTQHLMAHALILQGQYQKALSLSDPKSVPPVYAAYAARMQARALAALGKMEEARSAIALAQRLAPKDADTLVDSARFALAAHDMTRANMLLDSALGLAPRHMRALLAKGAIMRQTRGLASSLPYFNRALMVDPDNIEARLERAGTLGDLGKAKEARADLAHVENLVPNHPLALYLEAVMEARAGRYAQAQSLMTRTKGLLDRYEPAMLLQGMIAHELNNQAQAEQFLRKLLARNPNSIPARTMLANILLKKGDARAVVALLSPLVEKQQADARILSSLAAAHTQLGNSKEAKALLAQAVAKDPKAAALQPQLAMANMMQGDIGAARGAIVTALKTNPRNMQALTALALLEMKERRYRAAWDAAHKMVGYYPNQAQGYNLRGAAALALDNRKGAEANFRIALQKQPDFTDARHNLARLLMQNKRGAEARDVLLGGLEQNRNDHRAMMLLAALAAQQGRADEQVNWLRQAVTAAPRQSDVRLALAQTYLVQGKNKQALDEASALQRDFPDYPPALRVAGMIYAANGRTAAAQDSFTHLRAVAPQDVTSHILLARAQEASGQMAAARTSYSAALRLPAEQRPALLLDMIGFEGRRKNWDAAENYVQRFLALRPRDNSGHIALADAYFLAGQSAQAVKYYQQAYALSANRTAALKLAAAYRAAGQNPRAHALLTQFQQSQPKDMRIMAARGDLLMADRQFRAAARLYEDISRLTGHKDAAVLNNLAYAYQQIGDKRMVDTAKKAYALAPRSGAVADTYGWILLTSKGDEKLALRLLEQAAKARPQDPNVRYHLAHAYYANGQAAQARKHVAQALKTPAFLTRARAVSLQARLK